MVVADNAAHTDWFEKGFVELGGAPIGRAIGADGNKATVGFGFVTDVEHHTSIIEFDGDGLVRIDPFVGARYCDLASQPVFALIVAKDGGGDAWTMRIAPCAGGEPNGHDESAGFELDTVIWAGGEHFPVVVFFEGFEGVRDLVRRAPRNAIVVASLIKGAHVFKAEQHVNRAVLVSDEDGVVVSHVGGIDVFQFEGKGVLSFFPLDVDDALRRAPVLALISAATQQDPNVVPVTSTCGALPRLTPRQYRTLGRHNDTGNVIDVVSGIFASHKDVLFVDEGINRRDETDEAPKQHRKRAENGDGIRHGSYTLPAKNGLTIVATGKSVDYELMIAS